MILTYVLNPWYGVLGKYDENGPKRRVWALGTCFLSPYVFLSLYAMFEGHGEG